MLAYDPLTSPFELPIRIMDAHCSLTQPLALPTRAGASLGTTVTGAYQTALFDIGCARSVAGGAGCATNASGAVECGGAGECAGRFAHGVRSSVGGRTHASPIVLRAHLNEGGRVLHVRLILFGRRALLVAATAVRALEVAGGRGLKAGGKQVPFAPSLTETFNGSLGEYVERVLPLKAPLDRIMVEFSEPCAAPSLDVGPLLGNLAHDLVQWDLEDRGIAPEVKAASADAELVGRLACDALGDAARRDVRALFSRLDVLKHSVAQRDLGMRRSATNGNAFPLRGFTGRIELRGDLTRARSWLVALSLRGAGAHKASGLGAARLWVPL